MLLLDTAVVLDIVRVVSGLCLSMPEKLSSVESHAEGKKTQTFLPSFSLSCLCDNIVSEL